MDTPAQTLERQTVQTIGEAYYGSLNDPTTRVLHLVETKRASPEEIKVDTKGWYSGFIAGVKLLGGNPTMLPDTESVVQFITKTFPDRAKLAA